MLTTKDLELIGCIAATGSLTAASKRLHITQSATSQRLASLHDRLNIKLVERRDGAMQLTTAGERVHRASQIVAGELKETMNELDAMARKRNEQIRVSTQCYTCYRWLPFVINAMRDEHPEVSVDVVPEATDLPYQALQQDQIDVALVSNPQENRVFPEQALFADELFAVMHRSHALAKNRFISANQFSGQTLILYTGDHHPIIEEILSPAAVVDYRVIQVRITEAIMELARSGQGVAIIAGWALDDITETHDLVAVRITKSGFKRSWRAVINTNCNDEHMASFLRHVRAVGSTIGKPSWRDRLRS